MPQKDTLDCCVHLFAFMYRRPILCTLYGAVDFLNVLKKGCWGEGFLLVPNEIHHVPIGDGWEKVLVHNVLHYVPVLQYVPITHNNTTQQHSGT
jgi:hypothetical protein